MKHKELFEEVLSDLWEIDNEEIKKEHVPLWLGTCLDRLIKFRQESYHPALEVVELAKKFVEEMKSDKDDSDLIAFYGERFKSALKYFKD